jgi:hypothetical protein
MKKIILFVFILLLLPTLASAKLLLETGDYLLYETGDKILFEDESGATVVATPTFSPDGGRTRTTVTVTIACATGSSVICYTTDGSSPAASTPGTCSAGTTYSTPIDISVNLTTLKALGTAVGDTNSDIKQALYLIGSSGRHPMRLGGKWR